MEDCRFLKLVIKTFFHTNLHNHHCFQKISTLKLARSDRCVLSKLNERKCSLGLQCNFFCSGDRKIGRQSGTITLDAKTLTRDPDKTSDILSCNWRCEDQDGGLCYSLVNRGQLIFASLSGCKVQVDSSHFSAGKNCTIRFAKHCYHAGFHL